ncbi:MAG: redox-regulated ATPase YchF [Erysipelotrichaceae bacterium]|nr:redox-regulated ATPase YchF [Erysipelotrichaceae bacterium]
MSLKAGIVGLPNVGKSTLFNAITKQNILAANYPFATIEPNVGIVSVPDMRMNVLNDMYMPERLILASFEFTDIAGLVKGASTGEGLGNKFLSHIREVDAIVEVVRCFDDNNIIHVEGGCDPVRDVEIINLELTISDLEIINNRLEKIEKKAMTTKDSDSLLEVSALKKAKDALEKAIPLREISFTDDEKLKLKAFQFLTLKPIIYMANIDESDLALPDNNYVLALKEYAKNSKVIKMCAKVESELSELSIEEKEEMLAMLGIKASGLDDLINATYELLGLKTYFTVGPEEVRAWTFKDGMKAPACAGIIHTDFEKGFIKAEVISYEDLISCGSELKAKEAGKLRIEGKDYVMQDGDICHFRFNR